MCNETTNQEKAGRYEAIGSEELSNMTEEQLTQLGIRASEDSAARPTADTLEAHRAAATVQHEANRLTQAIDDERNNRRDIERRQREARDHKCGA